MWIKLRDEKGFRTTVEGQDIRVGTLPVEVKDSIGKALLKDFPQILESAKEPAEET